MLKFVEIENPALHLQARVFYVDPDVEVGQAVAVGRPIGHAHSLQQKYPGGITDHVHLELADRRGRKLDAETMIVARPRRRAPRRRLGPLPAAGRLPTRRITAFSASRPADGRPVRGNRWRTPDSAPAALTPRLGTGIVLLLALAVFINYVDRGNLATAAPLMKDELGLTAGQIGVLLSAFFWTYVPGQVAAGWLAEKINPYRALALGLALWSIATALTGLATGFVIFIALRLLLGLGESVAFPCSSKLLAQHLPPHRLGFANGLIALGLSLGPAFGTFAGGLLMAQLGWREVFILFGRPVPALALALAGRHPPPLRRRRRTEGRRRPAVPGDPRAPGKRGVRGLGHFCCNYGFLLRDLLAAALSGEGAGLQRLADGRDRRADLPGLCGQLAGHRLAFRPLDGGRRLRQPGPQDHHLLRQCAHRAWRCLGCMLGSAPVAIGCLFVAGVAFGFGSPNIFAIGQTLAGPRAGRQVGRVPELPGQHGRDRRADRHRRRRRPDRRVHLAFAVAAAVSLMGVVGWGLMIPRIAAIDWSTGKPPRTHAEAFAG